MNTDGVTAAAARWDAIVLAGGRARRMDSEDKLLLDVGGRSLLSRRGPQS